jgi:hypothetical protein
MTPSQINKLAELMFTQPFNVTRKLILNQLSPRKYKREIAWPKLEKVLDEIERQMSSLLRERPVVFWLRHYRALKTPPTLKDGKNDWWSTALVQAHAELAILKYGNNDAFDEMSNCSDFTNADLETLYRLEGMARQYHRIISMMRSLGKVGLINVSVDGDTKLVFSKTESHLLSSFDKRVIKTPAESTMVGTKFEKIDIKSDGLERALNSLVFAAARNTIGKPWASMFSDIDLVGVDNEVPKFIPRSINLRSFLDSHEYFAIPFKQKFKVGLDVTVSVLWAVGRIALGQTATSNELYSGQMVQLSKLGFGVFLGDTGSFVQVIAKQAQKFLGSEVTITVGEIRRVVDMFKFDAASQDMIALWSGGPRPVLFFSKDYVLIDLSALGERIYTLFFKVKHDGNERGLGFEAQLRKQLETAFGPFVYGEKATNSGIAFELDAALVIDNTLLIFECVSPGRALDYELGKPKAILDRTKLLEKKVNQVLKVEEIIKANPVGKKYDFSAVQKIVSIVVSPFVEWIWSDDQRLWINNEVPRILSTEEAVKYAHRLKENV